MTDLPAPPRLVGPLLVAEHEVPAHLGTRAIMSHVERRGDWTLPRRFRLFALMGQADLDLTEVRLGAGVSEIEVACWLSEVNVIVPNNLRVELHGEPFMGEFKLKAKAPSAAAPDAPVIRITGSSMMGNVTVKVVDPNAPKGKWLDRFRRKDLAG